jgi:hypothetical protein
MSSSPFRCRWSLAGLLALPLLLSLGCNPGATTAPRSDSRATSTEPGKTQPQGSTGASLKEPGHTPADH